MEALKHYLRDLFTGWQGIMSSTASIAFLTVGFYWKLAEFGQLRYWLTASFVCFFIAAYWAWHRQYAENQIAREVGSLAFEALAFGFNRHFDQNPAHIDVQAGIIFKNLQSRLMKYSVERYKYVVGSQEYSYTPLREAFVYANKESKFICKGIEGVPLNGEPVAGSLEYEVVYRFVGSEHLHHSRKTLLIEIRNLEEPAPNCNWVIAKEHED